MKILNDSYVTLFNWEDSKNFLKALKRTVNFISEDKIKNKYSEDNFNKFSDIVNNNLISNLRGLAVLEDRFFGFANELSPLYLDENFFKEKVSEVVEEIHKLKSFSTTNEKLINQIYSDLNAYTFSDESCGEKIIPGGADKINFIEADKLIEANSDRVSYLLSDVMLINKKSIEKMLNKVALNAKFEYGDFCYELDYLNEKIIISDAENHNEKEIYQAIKDDMMNELDNYLSIKMLDFKGNATYKFYTDIDGNNDFPIYVGIKLNLNNLDVDSQCNYLELLRDLFRKITSSKDNFGVIGISYDGQGIDVNSYEEF